MMTLGRPWPILQQGQIWSHKYLGKTVRKWFNGRNLQQMTRMTKGLCLYKNSDPKGLSAPALGLYKCIKTWKIMYEIRLQRYYFETCNKWAKWQGFSVDIRILSKGFYALAPGLYTCIKSLKMCIKSDFEEIILKLCNTWAKRKGLSVVIKILSPMCCLPLCCYSPGLYTCAKTWKNMYKIRLQRDCFKTCNKWAKW